MIYSINTEGVRFDRTQEDIESLLRIYNVGENPVRVRINSGDFGDAFIRNQFIDITITKTPVFIKSIGGESKVRTYRVYGNNKDECDISGLFEPITEESYISLIAQKAVQRNDVVQQLDNSEVNIPSTAAVSKAIKNVVSEIGAVLVYRGSVQKYTDLPTTNRIAGDTWNVVEPYLNYGAGTNFAWTGDKWDALGAQALDVQALEEYNANAVQKTNEYNQNHTNKLAAYNANAVQKTSALETIQDYCENARDEVEQAKESALLSEQNARASAQRANQSDANAKYWAKQAQENSDIGALQTGKVNSGVLHFNGGYVIGPKDDFIGTFDTLTICQTIKINNNNFENDYSFFFSIGVSGVAAKNDAIAFYIDKSSSTGKETFKTAVLYEKTRHPDLTAGTKSYYAENKDILTKILDGKFHTISLIFKVGEKLKLYVDGVLVATSDEEMPYSLVRDALSSSFPSYYSYGVGCRPMLTSLGALKSALISRCEVFNFDITAENAPYSINDYQNGKPIPPYLLDGTFIQSSDGNTTVSALSSSVFTTGVVDGKVRITKLNNNASSWNILSFTPTRSIKAGDILTFTFSPVVLVAGDTGEEYYLSPTSTAEYKLAENRSDTRVPIGITFVNGGTNTIVVPKDYSTIGITLPSYANSFQNAPYPENSDSGIIREGDYITFSFSMKVNGAELALENYTFNGEVLDYSGNGRHGKITGNVAGDNDTKVETLFEKFSARIANQTNG